MNAIIISVLFLLAALIPLSLQACSKSIPKSDVNVTRTAPLQRKQNLKSGSTLNISCEWNARLSACDNHLYIQVLFAFHKNLQDVCAKKGHNTGHVWTNDQYRGQSRIGCSFTYRAGNTAGDIEMTLTDLRQNDTGIYFCTYLTAKLTSKESVAVSVDIDDCAANTDDCEQICNNTPLDFYDVTSTSTTVATAETLSTVSPSDNVTSTTTPTTTTTTTTTTSTTTSIGSGTITPSPTFKPSYSCACRVGYTLHSDGRSCGDVDECLTHRGGCQYGCENTIGSFRCLPLFTTPRPPNTTDIEDSTDNSAPVVAMYVTSFTAGCVVIIVTSLKP